ncbi:MAG: hypothetical protein KY434_05255 [Actinobacteria bacterium]|nr:hypothetical protein [Actinomycetota bacterium]
MRRQDRRPAPEHHTRLVAAAEHPALTLQRAYGNRALQRLAAKPRTAVQREDEREPDAGPPGSAGQHLEEQVQQGGEGSGETTLTP